MDKTRGLRTKYWGRIMGKKKLNAQKNDGKTFGS